MRALLTVLTLLACMADAAWGKDLAFGPFGDVRILGREHDPSMVAIVLSDAQGWGAVEEEMARMAGDAGSLVVGVDVQEYFARATAKGLEPNVSFELESLSKYAQKASGLPSLSRPLLLGHGAGAGIVYASLVQAPADTFLGGVSLGFRPRLPLALPFGIGRGLTWERVEGGIRYDAFTKTGLPWTVIQAEADPVMGADDVWDFVQGMRGVGLHVLTGAAGYADPALWRERLALALKTATAGRPGPPPAQPGGVGDLPLIEVRPAAQGTGTLAILVTGDGGWAGIDKDIAAILAKNGIGVIGLDSMKYFWTRRTPEGAGADLARIMRHYLAAWGGKDFSLIGFSLGADALPPMIANLPPDLRRTVRQVALLAPSRNVELEFHVSDWIHDDEAAQDIALLPEVRRIQPVPLLCVHGRDEKSSLCTELSPQEATIRSLPGSHHFDGDYAGVAALILEHLRRP
jgi:type IV secretory pathway VirJ component